MSKLLAIVEVEKSLRVLCHSEGCGKSVYKRIHVVNDNNRIIVLGQTCYSHLYGERTSVPGGGAYYTGQESRKLTIEERNLLSENTQKLIDQFEGEKQQLLEEKVAHSMQGSSPSLTLDGIFIARDVKCHYCKRPMKTRAKSVPVVGYKCEACIKENRGMSSSRLGSQVVGVRAYEQSREEITAGGSSASKDVNREQAEAYKNIRG